MNWQAACCILLTDPPQPDRLAARSILRRRRYLDMQKIIEQVLTHPWVLGIFFVVTLVVNAMALRRIRREEPHKYQKPGKTEG